MSKIVSAYLVWNIIVVRALLTPEPSQSDPPWPAHSWTRVEGRRAGLHVADPVLPLLAADAFFRVIVSVASSDPEGDAPVAAP